MRHVARKPGMLLPNRAGVRIASVKILDLPAAEHSFRMRLLASFDAALRIWRAERSLLRANTLSPGRRPTTVRRKITDATIDAKTREETGRFECGEP